jgi:hypothetical protein
MTESRKRRFRIMRFRLEASPRTGGRVPRLFIVFFALAGAVFLWTPSRWLWDSFQRFRAFQDAPLPGLVSEKAAWRVPSLLDQALPSLATEPDSAKQQRPVTFRLLAPAAKEVFLGGSFNNFNAREHPLVRRPDGLWETTLALAPGRYFYKFKVDGRWELDPTNPDKTPEPHDRSILVIR